MFVVVNYNICMNDVNIGEVIVHGVAFDLKNFAAVRNMDLNELYATVPRLFDLLEERQIDFVLVGGIAMLVYVEGRNTQDIDLIVSPEALDKLPELVVDERNLEFARAKLGDLQIDLLFTANKLFDKVRREHVELRRSADREIPCATVEGLLLLKLFALPSLYRQGRFDRASIAESDATALIANYHPDMEPIFSELAKHVLESDLLEVHKIVGEIQDRIARSPGRFGKSEDSAGE